MVGLTDSINCAFCILSFLSIGQEAVVPFSQELAELYEMSYHLARTSHLFTLFTHQNGSMLNELQGSAKLNGFKMPLKRTFLTFPQTQLTIWAQVSSITHNLDVFDISNPAPHTKNSQNG